MPRDSTVEWVEVGRLVRQPELKQTLERLQEAGIVKLDFGSLFLATGRPCSQASRSEYSALLRCVMIEKDDDLSSGEGSDIKLESSAGRLLLEEAMADQSLGDIYRHILSPLPIEAPHPEGVKTELFRYQLHSLNRMLQREQQPEMVQSDFWIPFSTGKGQHLYLHPSSLEIRTAPPSSPLKVDARGGILSEEMGSGKTLEVLALILSSRSSLPKPTEDSMASAVTSSLAMNWSHKEGHGLDPMSKRHLMLESIPYYSAEVQSQGKTAAQDDQTHPSASSPSHEERKKLPSLRSICAHVVRLSGQSIAPEQYPEGDARIAIKAMQPLLQSATPFYHLWPPLRGHRTPRVEVKRTPVKVYLSTATLVVVPGTLQAQWQGEIDKHTEPGALRVLYLPHAHSKIPPAIELANDYDLILLSHARLGKEHSEGSLEWKWPNVPRQCRCPYIGSSRTVQCNCPPAQAYEPSQDMSPLLQCEFKRLCVDEGHVAAGDSDMVRMAAKIRSECRWIVSGTPTESLVGSDLYRTQSSSDRRIGASKTEQKDLEKLHNLLGDFLGVPHLQQDWYSHYETPFKKGAMYSSTRLWNLLSRVMVRNQPQDIDYSLPPLQDYIVRLDFTRLERATFNVLQALILLNAIWSQREDDDYFFHYSNRKHLASIMENLSLSCFHFSGPNLQEQAEEALTHARKQLAKEGQWSDSDREQAELANRHLEEALGDAEWKNRSSDVVFGPAGLQPEVIKSWSSRNSDSQLSAEEIIAMQRAMRRTLEQEAFGAAESGDLERTEELITMGERHRRALTEKAKAEQSKRKMSSDDYEKQVVLSALTALPSSPTKRGAGSKRKSKMSLLDYTRQQYEERVRLPGDSELCVASLRSGSSTKLTQLLGILAGIPTDEKVIIFSNLDNVLYEVSTALDIAWHPHFIYASGSSQERRNEVISAFRSEQMSVRILLMKVNIGGRGLDLSCANHAIFLEPILDKSLRVQALKRTWRTGQTRPVHATTLVMKDTFEEDILRISQTARTQKLSEDPSMRLVVSNPTFVSNSTQFAQRTISPPILLFPSQARPLSTVEIALPTPPKSPEKQSWIKSDSLSTCSILSQPSPLFLPSHLPPSPVKSPRPTKKRRVGFA